MEMALYYPGLGYYTKDSADIGRAGDFYTSPHLHRIFGAMIGRQMEEMWELLGYPEEFHIVELGAGMGYLAKDMIEYIQRSAIGRQETLFERFKYSIVELSPAVRARQMNLLSGYLDKVRWLSDLNELGKVRGCFVSNELLDAFPVRLVEMDDELTEIYIDAGDDSLFEIKRPCSHEVKKYFDDISVVFPRGYRTELNLKLKDWITDVSALLSEGFVLTIDYGYSEHDYYSGERDRGTLLCYYQHMINENPYQNIGEQDITAHVNFSSLKKWGEEAGLKTLGFCPQGAYLVSLGIDEAISDLYGESPEAFETAKIKGLILPHGMGESHKVMVQYKGSGSPELTGFSLRNRKGNL